jgi:hypothetical protein
MSLSVALAAFLTAHSAAGSSVYSFEVLDACGTDAKSATCSLAPVCEGSGVLCVPPRWNAYRGGWVRHEQRATATARIEVIAKTLVATANRMVLCKLPNGDVDFDCAPVRWGGGPGQIQSLSLFAATVALHESGLREDVQIGAPPMGRGPANETCLMQIMPDQVAANASWLTKDEQKPQGKSEQERIAQQLLGRSPEALGRCFEVGMRALTRARSQCAGDAGTFAAYGTGGRCGAISSGWVTERVRTLTAMRTFVTGGAASKQKVGEKLK